MCVHRFDRCMAVKSTPVQHEEVDYAELCTRLQQQVNTMEATMTRKLNEQQEKYEAIISELREEVKVLKTKSSQQSNSSRGHNSPSSSSPLASSKAFDTMLQYFHSFDENGYSSMNGGWVQDLAGNGTSDQALLLLAYCFDTMKDLHISSAQALQSMTQRAKNQKVELLQRLQTVRHSSLLCLSPSLHLSVSLCPSALCSHDGIVNRNTKETNSRRKRQRGWHHKIRSITRKPLRLAHISNRCLMRQP
jgi:hypothetical protein